MSSYPATPQRGHLYWAQVPYHKNLLQNHIGSLPPVKLAELNVKLALALDLVVL